MENSVKALFIASGVLMGIMILSIAAYLYSVMVSGSRSLVAKMDEKYVSEYNYEFLNYDSKDDNTIADVVSAKNYAVEKNSRDIFYSRNKLAAADNQYIDVYIGGTRIMGIEDDKILLTNSAYEGKLFRCTVEFNNYGLASIVRFIMR